jgi:hypothetical protein
MSEGQEGAKPQQHETEVGATGQSRETRSNPEAQRKFGSSVKEVQGIIVGAHNLHGISEANVWNDSEENWVRLVGASEYIPVPSTLGIQREGRTVASVIHFQPDWINRYGQASTASRLRGEALPEMLALIEETSHHVYMESYEKQFPGQTPNRANVELMGVIDKYNVLQFLYQRNFGRLMNPEEHQRALSQAANSFDNPNVAGDRPPEYILGHELGRKYVQYLIGLHNSGQDASWELDAFYRMSNKQQLDHLLNDLKFNVNTRSEKEQANVNKTIRQIVISSLASTPPSVSSQH